MRNLDSISRLRFDHESAVDDIRAIVQNRDFILSTFPLLDKSMAPASPTHIHKHLEWLDEFLVSQTGKSERTPEQYRKYLAGWVAVLSDIPANITEWAFGQWLCKDTPFYPSPGQVKALAKEKAEERRVVHARARIAFNYLTAT